MKNKEKRTLFKNIKLLTRAIGILDIILPGFWTYRVIGTLFNTFTPYFGLFMTAAILNELAGNCRFQKLLILAGITIVGGFIISLVSKLIQRKISLIENRSWEKHEGYLFDAQNRFQYEHLENPDVITLRNKIYECMNATGAGLMSVAWQIPAALSSVLNIIFSVSLTVSMFGMVASGSYRGILAFVNSPASAVVIIVLIIVNSVFSITLSNSRTNKLNSEVSKLGALNTRLNAYADCWGEDMWIFNLHRIILEEYRKYNLRPKWVSETERISIRYNTLTTILNALLSVVIYLFVAAKAFIGVFGIGNFVLYEGTVSRFIGAVSGLAVQIGEIKFNSKYLIQLYEYLDLPNEMYKGTLAVEKRDDIDYDIEFRDVSFKYPRTEAWALRHVNLKFKIGDKLAIVGENGSGKTTFIKLLCRLYDPTEGKILLNGIDITRYRYDEYMSLFSVVFQDYSLFAFPLGENVAASLNYDKAKVRNCLVRAEMGSKLESLENDPDNELDPLDIAIGQDYDSEGVEFSGGEMQKIALARALYKDAPFVILDEPTAALDPIAEAAVYENFNTLTQNKTSVFISHRLSSCRFCDEIAVFDHGMLVQEGTHDALVGETGGKYAELWSAQAKYYEGESAS